MYAQQIQSANQPFPSASAAPPLVEQLAPGSAAPALLEAIQAAESPHAWLGLSGDKHALLARGQQGLLLYAQRPRYWIALADASGSRLGRERVLARFLEASHAADARPVFYQADAEGAQQLATQGFRAYKLGEEARVALTTFSLDGGARKSIRQNVRKLEREGVRFELLARPDAAILAACAEVSGQWLAGRRSGEKQFSLGRFDPAYLACMPLALVWQGDTLLAFANVLQSIDRSVLSVDLMRHASSAPRGTMDFLFARLMEWGRVQGYAEFSLGMAPLAAIEADPRTPHWPALARLVLRFGERYYSFQGLRRFKEKWQPSWQPRYLLCQRRRDFLPALLECAVTIAGGKRALVGKR